MIIDGKSNIIDLAKPKSGARIFFFPARLKGTMPCPGQD